MASSGSKFQLPPISGGVNRCCEGIVLEMVHLVVHQVVARLFTRLVFKSLVGMRCFICWSNGGSTFGAPG